MKKLPTFRKNELFEQAFVHRSYLNETRSKIESNERLEFLGDSIISFVVSDHLYETYPHYNEGILTNLRSQTVNTKSLAGFARELSFGKYLKLSKGEEESKGRENESMLANCFEAFTGALFLDQGLSAVKDFLSELLFPQIEDFVQKKSFKDPKSLLQELVQAKKMSSPIYKVMQEEGPPHAKKFTMGVYVNDKVIAEGMDKSKQIAEKAAAIAALEKMGHS